jgi:regulator of protease activity HflC (stomatin/prohibitin superfamily)
MIFAGVVCTVLFFVGRALRSSGKERRTAAVTGDFGYSSISDAKTMETGGTVLAIGAVVLFLLWVGLHTLVASVHQVPAGHAGVVREFGAIVAQTEDGFQLIPPWRELENADTRVQTWAFTDDPKNIPAGAKLAGEGLGSFSEETQDVFINATLNIEVSPGDIQELYRNVGADYFDKLVPTRVRQLFKNETVKFEAVDIAPNREQIRTAVEENLRQELSNFSIDVVALLIDNIDFNESFKSAIEAKQVATQNAQEEAERITQRENEALQAIAVAEGTKQARITVAEGQAEANRLLNESLTDKVIQFEAIQKLGDDLDIAILPAGEGVIIDPTTLLTPNTPVSPP